MDREVIRRSAAASDRRGLLATDHPLYAARGSEIFLGPYDAIETVAGIPVALRASAFLKIHRVGGEARIDARVVADLTDLQRRIGALIDSLPLPRDNCARFAVDNLVVKLARSSLRIAGNVATLEVTGRVEIWTCLEIPFFGSPLKTHTLPPQSFEALIPVRLRETGDRRGVELHFERPSLNLRSDFGRIVEGVLSIAGVDISTEAHRWLEQTVGRDWLPMALPERFPIARTACFSRGTARPRR